MRQWHRATAQNHRKQGAAVVAEPLKKKLPPQQSPQWRRLLLQQCRSGSAAQCREAAREALACISQWQQRGYMATEGGKTVNRASSLKVVKYLESGQ